MISLTTNITIHTFGGVGLQSRSSFLVSPTFSLWRLSGDGFGNEPSNLPDVDTRAIVGLSKKITNRPRRRPLNRGFPFGAAGTSFREPLSEKIDYEDEEDD